MAYITLAKMKAALPDELTAQLLDDHRSGLPDAKVWPAILAAVEGEIDGKLAQRYPLPLSEPIPKIIEDAAFVLAAELIYLRRNFHGDANPWSKRAQGIRGTVGQQGGQPGLLDQIAAGEVPLTFETPRAKPSGSIISQTAKTTPTTGHLLC